MMMHTPALAVVLGSALALPLVARAATYYVDANAGNDGSDGSTAAPWRTVAKVNATTLRAGDTVLFKRDGRWNEALRPPGSGASGAVITFGAFGTGAKPILRNASISNRSYLRLQDLQLSTTTSESALGIVGSSHLAIEGCDLFAEATSTAYAVVMVRLDSHHNTIRNSVIAHRNLTIQNDGLNLSKNANYNLIEDNTFGQATHYALSLEGSTATYPDHVVSFNVIRNNTLVNPEGALLGMVSNSNRNLVEGNVLVGGKSTSMDNNSAHSLKLVGQHNIVRRNIVRDNAATNSYGLSSSAYQYNTDPANQIVGNRVYNNVITGINRSAGYLNNDGPTVCVVANNIYKNNIFFDNGAGDGGLQLTITQYVQGPDYFFNNLFYRVGVTNVIARSRIGYSVAAIEAAFPTEFSGNLQVDPSLDATLHPIAGSPVADAGTVLTTVTSAAGSGTVLALADAAYFTDGFGIVAGDAIRVGDDEVTLVAVDYVANTVIVDRPIAWAHGDEVSLPFNGARPYLGVFDPVAGRPVPPPSHLRLAD